MTVSEIKLLAFNQTEPPVTLNMAEQILYLTLSDVYRRFRSGDISQSDGERLIRASTSSFQTNNENLKLSDRIIQNHAELWKRIEASAAAYVMSGNRTPEADAFVEAVYGVQLKPEGVDQNDNIEDP